jgi:putative membrane protein
VQMLTVMQVEWTRLWRNKLRRIGLFSMLLLPLLYSCLYLWAFWDPYGSLDKLPVALVNEDTGGTQDGKTVNFGKDLQKTLVMDKALDWHVVNHQAALDGLRNNQYYMVLDIPKSFTSDVLSVGTNHPRKANLVFTPNQGKNYLAGQISSRVQSEIAATLAQNLSQKYIQRLLDVVGRSKSGMSQIAQTASKLASGSQQVASGAKTLSSSVGAAKSGSTQLDSALHQLAPGSSQIAKGLGQVQQGTAQVQSGLQKSTQALTQIRQQISPLASPTGQLVNGASQLADGAQRLSSASAELTSAISQATAGANQIRDGANAERDSVTQLQAGISQSLQLLQAYQRDAGQSADPRVVQAIGILQQTNEGLNQLAAALAQTQQGANQLASALSQVQTGAQRLNDGLRTLSQSAGQLKAGTSQFQQGIAPLNQALGQVQSGLGSLSSGVANVQHAQSQLQAGAAQVSAGLAQSAAGSHKMATGMDALQSGANHLATGASQLADGQTTFAHKVSDAMQSANLSNPNLTAELMSHPVNAETHPMFPVNKYGQGLAPYFMPLSLWVGALMLYFLVPMREGRWRVTPVSRATVALGKFSVLWCIGVGQALIASTVLLYGLKLTVTSVPLFYLFNILLSIVDITVIGMFITLLGTGPGRFIAIVLLLLQLTSSGGTFPLNLVPSFFQAVHPLLPMSYGVSGLRNIIAIHDMTALAHDTLTTAIYGLMALLIVIAAPQGKLTPKKLRVEDTLVP